MKLPDRINNRWISTLSDTQLQTAERSLKTTFSKQEAAEKKRLGDRYDLMRSQAPLFESWMRWSMVSNAARARGILIPRR